MAAVRDADYSIATNGDIRFTGSGNTYNNTVIEFHRWLGDKMDDALASGNDLLDITDATASERSTDNIITLKAPYNIDDTLAQHLFDGSIIQGSNGSEIYEGILVFAPADTPLQILQNAKPAYPNFWTTGLNADANNGISHRFMLKVRTGGTDIDGRRLVGQTRSIGKTYSEFKINGTARGNNVLALTYATDLNNQTAEATIRGWTTISNTEGYQLLDVDNNTTAEPYYSQWNRAALTINQYYERHKWLTRESTIESSHTGESADFQVANATVIGQSQSFANGVNAQYLTRVRVKMKKFGSPTGNLTAKLYAHSGTFGTSSIPTGAALSTSVNFDVATLTTAYVEYEIAFITQDAGNLLAASTNYCIALEHAVIAGGSDYVQIAGVTTSGHAGNRAQLVTTTWTPTAADDLYFKVYASPKQYNISGEVFRGITHEVALTSPSGTFSATELVSWGSAATAGTGTMVAIDSVTAGTKMWIQLLNGVAPSASVTILGGTSTATATNSGTPTERTLSQPAVGASTGSAIIGSYGLGIELADLTASDKLTDLNGDLRLPPNNVTFTVSGLSAGTTLATTVASGTGTVATITFATQSTVIFPVGSTVTVAGVTPTGYNGTYQVTVATTSTVSYANTTTGAQTVAGTIQGDMDRVLVAPLGYEFAFDGETGTDFVVGDALDFTTPTGTGYLSAVRYDTATTGRMQIRLLTGSIPTDNTTITNGTATALVNGTVVASEDPRQLILNTALDGVTTSVVCTATIPADTPSTGTIRIQMNTGIFRNIAYTAYTSATFTIGSTDFTSDPASAQNSIFISYIDKYATATSATFTGVYLADRSLFIRVRDGASTPIKTFETTGTLGSAGGSATAIRTSDV